MVTAQRDLTLLAEAQRRLLPQHAPLIPGYEVCLAYQAARAATGDYHDFFRRHDGQTALFVGDGSGHGPASCMLMATMRTILRTHPELHHDPGDTLASAGRWLGTLTDTHEFMTGVYMLLGGDGRVSWAAAGQDPPLRIATNGMIATVDLRPVGLPLGLADDSRYTTVRWRLQPGEQLVLFTDGLVEAARPDGAMFGRARLRTVLTELADVPLPEMIRRLLACVEFHLEGNPFGDDFTLVAVRRCR